MEDFLAVVMPVRMKRALVSRDRSIFAGLKRVGSESRKGRTTDGSWPPPPLPSWNSPRRCAFRAKILGPFFHSLSTRGRGAERDERAENSLFISRTRIEHLASTGFPLPWNSRVVSVSITRGGYLSAVSSPIYT